MTRRTIEDLTRPIHRLAVLSIPCADCGAGAGDPCVTFNNTATVPGKPLTDFHTPRRMSGGDAYRRALLELGDQLCPFCGQPVGNPDRGKGWHRCRQSPQFGWIRDELARLRKAVVDAVGAKAAAELMAPPDQDES